MIPRWDHRVKDPESVMRCFLRRSTGMEILMRNFGGLLQSGLVTECLVF